MITFRTFIKIKVAENLSNLFKSLLFSLLQLTHSMFLHS